MALIFSFWFQLLFWTKHAAHRERAVFEESGTGVDFDPLDVALGSRFDRLAGAHESLPVIWQGLVDLQCSPECSTPLGTSVLT